MNLVPFINRDGAQYDIYSLLLKDRIVFLNGEIDNILSGNIVSSLLYLESQSTKDEISIYINSPGGSITDALAIYDTISYLKAPVHTIAMGLAASAASLILAAGDKRSLLEHTKIMIHQPLINGGLSGKETDITIIANELTATRHMLAELYAKKCKKSIEQIEKDIENDRYMTAQQALEYGICDEIIKK